jgi:DNA invertase Pin-like site-specific DNA recombinase
VDSPEYFLDDTDNPSRELVRVILGAVSAFEKKGLVLKLKKARERKKAETGRCEGRPPVPSEVVREAKRLRRRNPKTGKQKSFRKVANELAKSGFFAASGKPYGAESIKRMINRSI